MSLAAEIKSRAAGAAGLVALVRDRVYPVLRDQGSMLPAITYRRAGGEPITDLEGEDASLVHAMIEFDCWAYTYDEAYAVGLALTAAMLDDTATLAAVPLTEPVDAYDEDSKLFHVVLDYSVWYLP